MIGNKQLASRFAVAVAMATLVGASVFAESRPSNETRARGEDRGVIRRERVADGTRAGRGDESRNRGNTAQSTIEVRGERNRSDGGRIERDRTAPVETHGIARAEPRLYDRNDRNRGDRNSDNRGRGSIDRSDRNRSNNRDNGNWRNDSPRFGRDSRSGRTYGNGNGTYRRSDGRYPTSRYGNREHFRYSGRVHRVYPYGGGYRVWLTGCQYPFFIPSAYYHRDRFRVGLTIALGGYYNSRGYYDYYDGYDEGYYDSRTSRGELRGVVESVDYRRETFVVRNDATGSFVTVVMRDRGRDPVRAGDYVELGGDWSRGIFEAYRVDIVDYDSRR